MKTVVVYIVDDDDSVRQGLSRLMRAAGFEARAFESAECFLRDVTAEPPACILLDIAMPHLSGHAIQASLNDKGIHLPVIAVSACDDGETRSLARRLGATFFFRKPVDDQALIDAITWVTTAGDNTQRSDLRAGDGDEGG